MSREVKIILAILAGLLALCACAAVIGLFLFQRVASGVTQSMGDPTAAAEAAQEIAQWEVPDGYEQAALSLLGLNMVVISRPEESQGLVITMVQVPASAGLSRQQVEEQIRGTIEQRLGQEKITFEETGEEQVTLRGEEITMAVREGQDQDGESYRQISGVFSGNGGPALIAITAPVAIWDPALVEEFLASIQ